MDQRELAAAFAQFTADPGEYDSGFRPGSPPSPGFGCGYDYPATSSLDALRARDFPNLDQQRLAYLDYTGGCIAPLSLVQQHLELLTTVVLGNPHSRNPPSVKSSALESSARMAVLKFFNAAPEGLVCIWFCVILLNVTNATA